MAFNNGEASTFTSGSGFSSAMSSIFASRISQFSVSDASSTPAPATTTAADKSSTDRTTSATSTALDLSSTGKKSSKLTSSSRTSSNTLSRPATVTGAGASSGGSFASITSPTGATFSTSYTSEAASAGTSGSSAVLSDDHKCSSISCSSGLQAAVAVPVALAGLGLIIALVLFARRRRKREDEKSDLGSCDGRTSAANSRWTRHLRVFSFDAELLIGGRSSNNSIRSGPESRASLRSQRPSVRSNIQPSVRSLESPAPPYRDAISQGQPIAERPSSVLTAPPAYVAAATRDRPHSRLSVISRPSTVASTDPFADPDDPDSPIGNLARRISTAYHPVQADDHSFVSSIHESEDAGSILDAQEARAVSGLGRHIDDIRNST